MPSRQQCTTNSCFVRLAFWDINSKVPNKRTCTTNIIKKNHRKKFLIFFVYHKTYYYWVWLSYSKMLLHTGTHRNNFYGAQKKWEFFSVIFFFQKCGSYMYVYSRLYSSLSLERWHEWWPKSLFCDINLIFKGARKDSFVIDEYRSRTFSTS